MAAEIVRIDRRQHPGESIMGQLENITYTDLHIRRRGEGPRARRTNVGYDGPHPKPSQLCTNGHLKLTRSLRESGFHRRPQVQITDQPEQGIWMHTQRLCSFNVTAISLLEGLQDKLLLHVSDGAVVFRR